VLLCWLRRIATCSVNSGSRHVLYATMFKVNLLCMLVASSLRCGTVVLLCNLGAETWTVKVNTIYIYIYGVLCYARTVKVNTIYMELSVMPGKLEVWPLNAICASVVRNSHSLHRMVC